MSEPSPFDSMPPGGDSVSEGAGGIQDLKRTRPPRRQKRDDGLNTDRLPPHSVEMEQCALGCCLLIPAENVPKLMEKLGTAGADVFYDLRHQTIWAALAAMQEAGTPIDVITLMERLKMFDLLEQVGGIPYLNQIQDAVPSAANLSYYADIIFEKFLIRKLIATCADISGRAFELQGEINELFDIAERDILAIRSGRSSSEFTSMNELVPLAMQEIERKIETKGQITGLRTGFIDLDMITDGLHPAEVTIIAAFPSVGKTSLAMNIIENIALNTGVPCGMFSLEMPSLSVAMRSISSIARVNLRQVSNGFLSERDMPKLVTAAGRLAKTKIYFDDSAALSIYTVRTRARKMAQLYGIKLLVVDYLQLMNSVGGSRRAQNGQEEIAAISKGIKQIAKELSIPVIVLSQLTETEKGVRLRGSADIFADADNVYMLKEPKDKDEGGGSPSEDDFQAARVELWLTKQRNGQRNVKVDLLFLKSFTKFESASRVSDEDVPQPRAFNEPPEMFPEEMPRD